MTKLSIKEKLYWRAFWVLRAAYFGYLTLISPEPQEGEFCGDYLDRIGSAPGPYGTTHDYDVISKVAVWRSGQWTLEEGDEDAYYAANPFEVRPVVAPSNDD